MGFFGERNDSDEEPLLYACTECPPSNRNKKEFSRPGLSGGMLYTRCGDCKTQTVWKCIEDE